MRWIDKTMINKGMYSSETPEWATPQKVFDTLNDKWDFTLDPCSTHENAKVKKHYTKDDDGLSRSWDGERVFMNPPYGRVIGDWVKKASEIQNGVCVCVYSRHGRIQDGFTIIFLLAGVLWSFCAVASILVMAKIPHLFQV